jgi:hypothetical protein
MVGFRYISVNTLHKGDDDDDDDDDDNNNNNASMMEPNYLKKRLIPLIMSLYHVHAFIQAFQYSPMQTLQQTLGLNPYSGTLTTDTPRDNPY